MLLRLSIFLGVFACMALWEVFAPRRQRIVSRSMRWRSNIALTAINSLMLRLLFPAAGVGMAITAENFGLGLFNILDAPTWVAVGASFILLDLVIYWQHVAMHRVPMLWRLHRVHHADLDIDVTTGARFHPIEILISMLIKFAAIGLLSAPVVAVLAFEIVLNGMAMFNHSNIALPRICDSFLRALLVTPDVHRVHHSVIPEETNSNYGFNFSFWDRVFGTYKAQPQAGHEAMVIGLREWRDPQVCCRLPGMLTTIVKG